jgi:hypothetical protein
LYNCIFFSQFGMAGFTLRRPEKRAKYLDSKYLDSILTTRGFRGKLRYRR